MKQKLKSIIVVIGVILGAVSIVSPTIVSAADSCAQRGVNVATTTDGDCTKKTAFSFGDCKNTNVGINCLVAEVMSFLSILVGIAVVAGITVGGIVYSTGSGNPAKTQKGVTIIVNSLIGLLLYFLMYAIIRFLLPGDVIG